MLINAKVTNYGPIAKTVSQIINLNIEYKMYGKEIVKEVKEAFELNIDARTKKMKVKDKTLSLELL